uniref:Uncharacterized protein n=1 Tax=Magallana gigas TaxID=29159 RepID=A0A8W8NXR0_MAGGI
MHSEAGTGKVTRYITRRDTLTNLNLAPADVMESLSQIPTKSISPHRTLRQMNTHVLLMRRYIVWLAHNQPYNGDSWDIDRIAAFCIP